MASSLPKFSRGLKLARIGIIVMLLQLVLTIIVTVKAMAASTPEDGMSVIKWTNYLMIANITAMGLMVFGTVSSLGELARNGVDTKGLILAVIGFAVAAGALVWTYHVFNNFLELVLAPESSLEDVIEAGKDIEPLKYVTMVKDLGYTFALILLARTVQRSAAHNDQLGLRDEAGHMSRAIIVMLVGDLFYQLTYGLGGSVGIIGAVGSLLIGCYWIWCHIKLVRFFESAAHHMSEPHELPIARAVKVPEVSALKPKPVVPRQSRPSIPRVPTDPAAPPILVVAPPAPAPVPRADTDAGDASGGDKPKFLT